MQEVTIWKLLHERRFAALFWTQFLGAFNDNLFKNALVIFIAFQGVSGSDNLAGLSNSTLINLSAGLFILPFFLFSAIAGQLADRVEKAGLIQRLKLLETAIMALAALAFWSGQLQWLLATLFLMGTQSAFFGPVKYAILPQQLDDRALIHGNGLVETGTFIAILAGTILGGTLISLNDSGRIIVSAGLLITAVAGWLTSRHIPAVPVTDPTLRIGWNPLAEAWRNVRITLQQRSVFLATMGTAWFWFLGSIMLIQLPEYAAQVLGADANVAVMLLTLFALGIGSGSLLCARLAAHRVEIGLVPVGAAGISLFSLDLAWAWQQTPQGELMSVTQFVLHNDAWRVMADLFLLSAASGLFIVPLQALIQERAQRHQLARVISAGNIISALAMVIASILAVVLLDRGYSIPQLFLIVSIMNAAVAVYLFGLLPEFLARFVIWLMMHSLYRLRYRGLDNIPEHGAALLVCNHVSFVDALILTAASPRPIRFVMHHRIYDLPILNSIFRAGRAIPIASGREHPELLQQAMAAIESALADGELVCIFPEGSITRDGNIQTFRRGIEHMLARSPVPVIPMSLGGLWGSFFSRHAGRAMASWPRRFWAHIELSVGRAIPAAEATAAMLQGRVEALRGERR